MTTFADKEYSIADGHPFEMYEFVRGTWSLYLTTRKDPLVENGSKIFAPSPITRTKFRQGQDTLKDTITLTIPRSDNLAREFLILPPEETTSVTIKKLHEGLDVSAAIVVWKGRIIGAKAAGESVEIDCESIFTSIKRVGLREKTERICQNYLYSTGCSLSQPSYKVTDRIQAINGTVVTMQSISPARPDGYFTGGILEYNGDRRFIIKHVGNILTLSRPLATIIVSLEVSLYPGCDHTIDTCQQKFNNVINYKGFPWIPSRNPFTQSIN